MDLTPREKDKLMIFTAGLLAENVEPEVYDSITQKLLH